VLGTALASTQRCSATNRCRRGGHLRPGHDPHLALGHTDHRHGRRGYRGGGATVSTFTMWVVLVATSTLCFGIKLVGYFVPARWLANGRLQRINSLIPVVLLSALVVAQALAVKTHIV